MKRDEFHRISFALRELLSKETVGTHDEIAKILKKQGFNVSQSKVSRLLHQIGAIKIVDRSGHIIYRLPHTHGLMHEISHPSGKTTLKQWVIDISYNSTIIVIHTAPGAAHLVAREIDLHRAKLPILGTIAGDDTIFIAPKEIKRIKPIIDQIKILLLD